VSNVRVKIWDETVGYLSWDSQNNTAVFELDRAYQDAEYNISPLLLDKQQRLHFGGAYDGPFQGLPPIIADSLPDRFGNRVFQEWLIQNNYHLNDLNSVDRLMYVASRGMGALEYEPGKDVIGSISKFDFNELAAVSKKIIENKYEYSDFVKNQEALQHILNIGSSVGGAQAKVLVAIHKQTNELRAGDVLHQGSEYDYYIVKLAYDSDTPWGAEKTSVEYVYHRMASECGIKMMPCELLVINDSVHFKTKRFDRVGGQKLHTQTLAALTGYTNRNVPFSYEQIFRLMEQLQVSHRDKEQLFKHMVFNVASCNMDDHMKNFGFIMERNGQWCLSPAYDLTYPFDPYLPSMMFHKMSINGKTKDVTREDVFAVGRLVGIRNSKGIVGEICDAVGSFDEKAKDFKISNRTASTIQLQLEKRIQLLR